jgi:hypothetical protein
MDKLFPVDLDFSIFKTNHSFSLSPYFSAITSEFEALGIVWVLEKKTNFSKTHMTIYDNR